MAMRFSLVLSLVAAFVGFLYAGLAFFFGSVPLDIPIYTSIFAVLIISNLIFFAFAARNWEAYTVRIKIRLFLWETIILWFWSFSTVYYVLIANLDDLQLALGAFNYIWLVVVCGSAFVFGADQLFKPLQNFLDAPEKSSAADTGRLAKRAARYPVLIASLFSFITIIGYIICPLILHYFAALPWVETLKEFIRGVDSSIFVGIIIYVSLLFLLEPLRLTLEKKGTAHPIRGSIARRILVIFATLITGTILLLQLVGFKSIQDTIRDQTSIALAKDTAAYVSAREAGVAPPLEVINRIDEGGQIASEDFSAQTFAYLSLHNSGITVDGRHTPKLVSVFIDPLTHEKSIALVNLGALYTPLIGAEISFFLNALFVFFASLAVVSIITSTFTRSVRSLINGIRALSKNPDFQITRFSNGDEIDELSEAFTRFVEESHELDKAKYEFVSVASHQLRTPLTHLVWVVGLLEKEGVKENIEKYFGDFKESVAHLSGIVKLLLDARKLDDANVRTAPQPVDLTLRLKELVERYRPIARERHIALTEVLPPSLSVVTDPDLLEIAVESLISNAIEYTAEKGRVTVTLAQEENGERISVADTGIGIPPETKEHLFEKFVRAANARHMRPNGTGLGLFIAKRSALKLKGDISFTSEENKGSTFTLTLPLALS